MRKYRGIEPPADITVKEQAVSTIKREYQLITPLFGGGAEPAERDLVTTIRASEIRGQLRFWWRACRAGDYNTLEKLKAAEDAIWGKAHKKGDKDTLNYHDTVRIEVEVSKKGGGKPVEPYFIYEDKDKHGNLKYKTKIDGSKDIPAYAAFPLQLTQEELDKNRPPDGPKPVLRQVYEDIIFTLIITFPKKRVKDINAALWAWQTFGGLGARTRRGFGALHMIKELEGVSDNFSDIEIEHVTKKPLPDNSNTDVVRAWVKAYLEDEKYVSSGSAPEGVPHLSKTTRFRPVTAYDNTKVAWKKLVARLEHFRQYDFGRSGRGGSYWPEANAIRYMIASRKNQRKDKLPPPLLRFPRAAFGLPIVFHFLKEDIDELAPTLQGAEKINERLASPIILRPLLCRDNKAVGLALLLDGYQMPPGKIVLKEKDTQGKDGSKIEGKKHEVETLLTGSDRSLLKQNGLNINKTDVLQAFMDYLEGNK